MPASVSSTASMSEAWPFGAGFKAAHTKLLRDPSFQFALQGPPPQPPVPFWLRWLGKPLLWLAPYVGWLLWALLAIVAILVVAFVLRGLWAGRKGKKVVQASGPNLSDWRPDAKRARALLSDADKLAAEGRFTEAARLLLHRSIEEIEQRRPTLVAINYTSRDIAGLDGLPPIARAAFARIMRQVEYGVFGQRTIDLNAYNACRAAYGEFAFPDTWATAGASAQAQARGVG